LPRAQRRRDLAEGTIRHVGIDGTKVDVIEDVEKVKTELEIAAFSELRYGLFLSRLASA
jgi:hypothetical protein